MKNLLKSSCSESEGSGSEGDGSTGSEGRGTSEKLSGTSRGVLLSISHHHASPGGALLCGETGEGGVDLGADLLGLEPGGAGSGISGESAGLAGSGAGGSSTATTRASRLRGRAVDAGHNSVPLGDGDLSSAGDGDSSAKVLGSGVGGDEGGELDEISGTDSTALEIDGLTPE